MRPLFVLAICLALVLSISAQAKNNGGGPKSPPTKAAESKIKGKPVTEQKASKKSGNTGKGPNSNPNSTGAGATRGPDAIPIQRAQALPGVQIATPTRRVQARPGSRYNPNSRVQAQPGVQIATPTRPVQAMETVQNSRPIRQASKTSADK